MRPESKPKVIRELSRRIRELSERDVRDGGRVIPTGWDAVDAALAEASGRRDGGLSVAGVHEFLSPPTPSGGRGDGGARPLCLLLHLAAQAARRLDGQIVWVGDACRPNPELIGRLGLLDRALFVDARDPADRLWAIDLAMRNSAVACVVGDGGALKLPATRRLELTAADRETLVLLGRPGADRATHSAALSRWALRPRRSETLLPAWTLELVRCKGMHLRRGGPWPLEWNGAESRLTVSAALVDRPSASADAVEPCTASRAG